MYFTNLHLQKVRVISDKEHTNNRGKGKIPLCQLRLPRVLYQSELAEMKAGRCGSEDDLTGPHRVHTLRRSTSYSRSPGHYCPQAACCVLGCYPGLLRHHYLCRTWMDHFPQFSNWQSLSCTKSNDQFLSLHIVSRPVSFPMFSREPLLKPRMNLPGHCRCARLMGEIAYT